MKLSCIWAMSENYVIGRDGDLPWRLSADLQRFKVLTMGHHIVMGRKTWESIGRPLPGRTSIVLTRDPEYQAEGCLVVQSLDAALEAAAGDDEVFVVGGASIYALALPASSRLYVTLVGAEVEGDVSLPPDVLEGFRLAGEECHEADEKNQYAYSFRSYERDAG